MDAIAKVKQRLADRPEFTFTEKPDYIEVFPPTPDGFPVALAVEPEGFAVYFGGWHEHFESETDALNCFSYGLLGDCRLKIRYRGSTAYKWTLEHRRNGHWVAEGTKASFIFPFWRRKREAVLCNQPQSAA